MAAAQLGIETKTKCPILPIVRVCDACTLSRSRRSWRVQQSHESRNANARHMYMHTRAFFRPGSKRHSQGPVKHTANAGGSSDGEHLIDPSWGLGPPARGKVLFPHDFLKNCSSRDAEIVKLYASTEVLLLYHHRAGLLGRFIRLCIVFYVLVMYPCPTERPRVMSAPAGEIPSRVHWAGDVD